MACSGGKWNVYKISHIKSFEVNDLKKKCLNTEQKVYNCINILIVIKIIFLQNMGTWKIEIAELFISVAFFSANHFISIGS